MARGQIEKRGQRRRKLKPVILIVTEGSQTEPKYFEHYRSRQTNIDIRVVGSRTKGGETDYLGLIRKAVEYQSKNQISASNGDAVWVVADGDVNYNNPDPTGSEVAYEAFSFTAAPATSQRAGRDHFLCLLLCGRGRHAHLFPASVRLGADHLHQYPQRRQNGAEQPERHHLCGHLPLTAGNQLRGVPAHPLFQQ